VRVMTRDLGLEREGSQMPFFVLKLCVYTHKPLLVIASD
jgi:hypothetical protein